MICILLVFFFSFKMDSFVVLWSWESCSVIVGMEEKQSALLK